MESFGVGLGGRDDERCPRSLALCQAGQHDGLCGKRHRQGGTIDPDNPIDLLVAEKPAAEADEGTGLSHGR